MKGLGILVRTDSRGLGNQTQLLTKFLQPERVLVVDMGPHTPYKQNFDLFPDSQRARFPIKAEEFKHFCDGLKWVLTCETFYGDDNPSIARGIGVKTACQFNREFDRWIPDWDWLPRPDVWIAPSTWDLDKIKHPYVYIPPPVDRERFPFSFRQEARTFLHIAGHKAAADRAGTRVVMECLRLVKTPINLIFRSQSRLSFDSNFRIGKVKVRYYEGDIDDNVDLYGEADVLVAPRRYGGLSLPLAEASSLGMPIIALGREPERSILDHRGLVPAISAGAIRTQGGQIGISTCDPRRLAAKIDELANNPELVEDLSWNADRYASTLSWDEVGPKWESVFVGLSAAVTR